MGTLAEVPEVGGSLTRLVAARDGCFDDLLRFGRVDFEVWALVLRGVKQQLVVVRAGVDGMNGERLREYRDRLLYRDGSLPSIGF